MFAINREKWVLDMYIIQWDALHGLVLLQGIHFVEVTIRNQHCPILCLIEVVDLQKQKFTFIKIYIRRRKDKVQKYTHMMYNKKKNVLDLANIA